MGLKDRLPWLLLALPLTALAQHIANGHMNDWNFHRGFNEEDFHDWPTIDTLMRQHGYNEPTTPDYPHILSMSDFDDGSNNFHLDDIPPVTFNDHAKRPPMTFNDHAETPPMIFNDHAERPPMTFNDHAEGPPMTFNDHAGRPPKFQQYHKQWDNRYHHLVDPLRHNEVMNVTVERWGGFGGTGDTRGYGAYDYHDPKKEVPHRKKKIAHNHYPDLLRTGKARGVVHDRFFVRPMPPPLM